jgi:heme exporter protein C
VEHAAPGRIDRGLDVTIHPSILVPLLIMMLAFTLLFLTLHFAAMRNEIMRRRVRTLMMMQAQAAAGA